MKLSLISSIIFCFLTPFTGARAENFRKISLPIHDIFSLKENILFFRPDWRDAYPCQVPETNGRKVFVCPEKRKYYLQKPTDCPAFIAGSCGPNGGYFSYVTPGDSPLSSSSNDVFSGPHLYLLPPPPKEIKEEIIWQNIKQMERTSSVVFEVDEEGSVKSQEFFINDRPWKVFLATLIKKENKKRILRDKKGDFIVVRIGDQSTDSLVFKNTNPKGKPKQFSLTSSGVFADQKHLCWLYANGLTCNIDLPFFDGGLISYSPQRGQYSPPHTVIPITSVKGTIIEFSYRGNTFRGDAKGFVLVPKKGSAIDQYRLNLRALEDKQLEQTGFWAMRRQLADCVSPKLKAQSCFEGLVGLDKALFIDSSRPAEEPKELTLLDLHKRLEENDYFSEVFRSCLTIDPATLAIHKDEVIFTLDEHSDSTDGCKFKKFQGKWIFSKIFTTDAC